MELINFGEQDWFHMQEETYLPKEMPLVENNLSCLVVHMLWNNWGNFILHSVEE